MKYNYLTDLGFIDRNYKYTAFHIFKCDCGNERRMPFHKVRDSIIKSCGCINSKKSHGMTGTRPHRIWKSMKVRCNNKNHITYKNYGYRGISICKEWESFEIFWNDMKKNYKDNLTIDRINVDGNYCKENCRWATYKEQANNKRNNKK